MTFIKLTTTFDTGMSSFSYVAYGKANDTKEMIFVLDMYGKIIGFSENSYRRL